MFKNEVEYRQCSCCGKELKEGFVIHLNKIRLQFCNEDCMLKKAFQWINLKK